MIFPQPTEYLKKKEKTSIRNIDRCCGDVFIITGEKNKDGIIEVDRISHVIYNHDGTVSLYVRGKKLITGSDAKISAWKN